MFAPIAAAQLLEDTGTAMYVVWRAQVVTLYLVSTRLDKSTMKTAASSSTTALTCVVLSTTTPFMEAAGPETLMTVTVYGEWPCTTTSRSV